ncbi:hypothetical protein JB92DRAFT_2884797 [Gautieria morchelliformis]|nr:hypothetical protein JB92DRAFT_2884797 [Gautieria morchelliformis]
MSLVPTSQSFTQPPNIDIPLPPLFSYSSSLSRSGVQCQTSIDDTLATLSANKAPEASEAFIHGHDIISPNSVSSSEPCPDNPMVTALLQMDMDLQLHVDFDSDNGPGFPLLPPAALGDMWVIPGLCQFGAVKSRTIPSAPDIALNDVPIRPAIDVEEDTYDLERYSWAMKCHSRVHYVAEKEQCTSLTDIEVSHTRAFESFTEPQIEVESGHDAAQLQVVPLNVNTVGDLNPIDMSEECKPPEELLTLRLTEESLEDNNNFESPYYMPRPSNLSRAGTGSRAHSHHAEPCSMKVRRSRRLAARASHREAIKSSKWSLETQKQRKRVAKQIDMSSSLKSLRSRRATYKKNTSR